MASLKNALRGQETYVWTSEVDYLLIGSVSKIAHSKVQGEGVIDVFVDPLAVVWHESEIIEGIVVGDQLWSW